MGNSTPATVPTRCTPSFCSASPIPPTTPATQVAPNSPTATTPEAIGEIRLDSSRARVSRVTASALSSASAIAGSGGQ